MHKPSPQRNANAGYLNPEIPDVTFNIPDGETYEDCVPATLDLQERAKLLIHAITETTHAQQDYEMSFSADFNQNPPVMGMTSDNICCQPKLMETLPLLRFMTGSHQNLEVDQRWMEVGLQMLGDDGLAYWPSEGRSFATTAVWAEQQQDEPQVTSPGFLGRMLSAYLLNWRIDGSDAWEPAIKKMVDGLTQWAVDKGDYAYLSAEMAKKDAPLEKPDQMPKGDGWATLPGWLVQGLSVVYREMNYKPALVLAEKFANYLINHAELFAEDGEFIGWDHFHHHSACVIGIAELALVTGNKKYEDFTRKCYVKGKAMGDVEVGFFPEGLRKNGEYEYPCSCAVVEEPDQTAETCEIADMIVIGLKLTQMGYRNCWDDVDQWVRNQFAENQMTQSDWIGRRLEELEIPRRADDEPIKCWRCETPGIEEYVSEDRVAEKHIGHFAGWATGNDIIGNVGAFAMHCCNGNGGRTLYYLWDSMVDFNDGTLEINLLMNHASLWADVRSHIPYSGRIDVQVKQDCTVKIRIPKWAKGQTPQVSAEGSTYEAVEEHGYLIVESVPQGAAVTVDFPISEETKKLSIGGRDYTVVIKGHDVVFIDPPGKCHPYYQRDHYRKGETLWVNRTRYITQDAPNDW